MTEPRSPRPSGHKALWLLIGVVIGLAVAALTLLVLRLSLNLEVVQSPSASMEPKSSTAATSPVDDRLIFFHAQSACASGDAFSTVGGDQQSVTLDGKAASNEPYGLTQKQEQCFLQYLGAPSSVYSRMQQTRGLDGTQSATWNQYSATWTYTPTGGLDIVISR